MSAFSPRDHFQLYHQAESVWIEESRTKRELLVPIDYAMSQLAAEGASADELEGARRFVNALLTIGSKTKEPLKFPRKELTVLDRHPDEPVKEETQP